MVSSLLAQYRSALALNPLPSLYVVEGSPLAFHSATRRVHRTSSAMPSSLLDPDHPDHDVVRAADTVLIDARAPYHDGLEASPAAPMGILAALAVGIVVHVATS